MAPPKAFDVIAWGRPNRILEEAGRYQQRATSCGGPATPNTCPNDGEWGGGWALHAGTHASPHQKTPLHNNQITPHSFKGQKFPIYKKYKQVKHSYFSTQFSTPRWVLTECLFSHGKGGWSSLHTSIYSRDTMGTLGYSVVVYVVMQE